MNVHRPSKKRYVLRLTLSIVVSGVALALFLMSRASFMKRHDIALQELSPDIVNSVDCEVDTVLTHFQIERAWIKKKVIFVPNSGLSRVERRVSIPQDILPVQVNVAMNAMAKRHDGRAIASENLKENSVTIHIEMRGQIIQTIILMTNREIRRGTQHRSRATI